MGTNGRIGTAIVTWLLAIAGCGDGVTDPFDEVGLHIISGGGGRDTVQSRFATPVVAHYRDSNGELKAGVQLRIDAIGYGNTPAWLFLGLGANSVPTQSTLFATTDSAGRVTVSVGAGASAGIGWVRVSAPSLGLADSTSFEVLPGAAVRLALGPIDTALYVGATIQMRAHTLDRWGNARSGDAVHWTSTPGIIEANSTGRVRGVAYGRAFVRAAAGSAHDSVGISVVPQGVIAALFVPTAFDDPEYVYIFETNGSNLRQIDIDSDCAHTLQWAHTQDRLYFARNPSPGICFTQRLYATTLTGTVSRIRPDTGTLDGEFWPGLTRDDQWIYFTGRPDHQNGEIWRVRPNGTGAERMGPPAGWYDVDQQPSPSPNGSEVVYTSVRTWTPTLHVLDVATRTVRSLGVVGHSPSWSPRGDLIAFHREDVYYVMKADGSDVRSLLPTRYSGGYPDVPSWSPDGRWIVAVTWIPGAYGKLALVEVETGVVLPLGWTAQLTHPSWRPNRN